MNERVWIAGWEMQCCGDRFAIGDDVRWRLSPAGHEGWLTELFGADAGPITSLYDHHTSEDVPEVDVTVAGIDAVFCHYEQRGRDHVPIAGSATREARTAVTGWEPESGPIEFVGYLVEAERA